MGVVYRARTSRGELVAIKLLAHADPASLARFDREVRLLRELGETQGFVPVIDDGMSERGRFLVMPFLGGGTLRDRLDRGPLGADEVRRLGGALARALGRAHERRIVHRDLKPENILFTATGAPLIADLGLAKHFKSHGDTGSAGHAGMSSVVLTREGELRGTVGYLAPEQVQDARSADGRADIFALGAVLYEAIAGVPAFSGENVFVVLTRLASGTFEPLPESVPRDLARVIEACLARRRRDRPRDAFTVARALEGEAPLPVRRRRSSWLGLVAGGLAVAAAAVAIVLAMRGTAPPPPPLPASLAPGPPALVPVPVPEGPAPDPRPLTAAERIARAPDWYRALPEAERPRLPLPGGLGFGGKGEYVNEADGSVLVYVPAGEFMRGADPEDPGLDAVMDAQPRHRVRLSAYFIGKYEVSNAQWRRKGVSPTHAEAKGGKVMREGAITLGHEHVAGATWRTPHGDGVECVDSQPVVQVEWAEARAYAKNVGLRLPTEAEWERAAGWDGTVLHRYPWVTDEPPDERLANVRTYVGAGGRGRYLEDVRSHPSGASPVGALNMSGNAAELVLDVYDRHTYEAYRGTTVEDPCVFDEGRLHVIRGGSYLESGPAIATFYRASVGPDDSTDVIGFRLALSEDGSPRPRPR
jgi:formylglycine-generating enzyme required for sulfatase activity